MKKLLAFTLSETLITLGIIGIIATLTLPNVMSNYKTKVLSAQLKKVYNQITSAAMDLKTESRVDSLADTYLSNETKTDIRPFFTDHFKVTNNCGVESRSDCFASLYKDDNSSINSNDISGYCVSISTGASICIDTMAAGVSLVTVDVNGKKTPNTRGKDLFFFGLYADGTLGGGDIEDIVNSNFEIHN